MSSTLIQRTVAATASSRSPLAAATARRFPHIQHQQHQLAAVRLMHRSSGSGTNSKEQLQSAVQPQNHKHPEHHQMGHPHAHHRHQPHHQQLTRRPSTSQAVQRVADAGSSHNDDDEDDEDAARYSAVASHEVLEGAAGEHQGWAAAQPSLEKRLQTMVERFGGRHFVDELPCRTRKLVAGAAAAGKEYVTAQDIIRVVETISDGKHGFAEDEAQAICDAWGRRRRSAGEGGGGVAPMPEIPKHVFLQLLKPSSEH